MHRENQEKTTKFPSKFPLGDYVFAEYVDGVLILRTPSDEDSTCEQNNLMPIHSDAIMKRLKELDS